MQRYSDEELQAELARRQEEERKANKPQQLEVINSNRIRNICQDYIDELYNKGYADDDFKHFIFETVLEAVFGTNVWEWIRKTKA